MSLPLRVSAVSLACLVATLVASCGGGDAEGDESRTANAPTSADSTDVAPLYRTITLEEVRAWYRATGRIEELERSDSAFAEAVRGVREQEDIDALVTALAALPRARDAIEGAGLTPASYVDVGFALYGARAADDAIEGGLIEEAPVQVNRANVELVRAHRAEIDGLHAGVASR